MNDPWAERELRAETQQWLDSPQWGQTVDLVQLLTQPGARVGVGAPPGDFNPNHAQDWTVYIQRDAPALDFGPGGPAWTAEVSWGSGGVQMRDTFPLHAGEEYVLHYVAGSPPVVVLINTSGLVIPPAAADIHDYTRVSVQPGRPSVYEWSLQKGMTFHDPDVGTRGYWADMIRPFGAIALHIVATAPTGSENTLQEAQPYQAGPVDTTFLVNGMPGLFSVVNQTTPQDPVAGQWWIPMTAIRAPRRWIVWVPSDTGFAQTPQLFYRWKVRR